MRRLIPLLLLLAGCPAPEAATASKAAPPPAPVSVASAEEPRLDRTFPVLGEVRTRHRAELAVGVDGPVTQLDVLEGDRVKAGQLLLQVDDSVARAELASARAAVEEAEAAAAIAQAEQARYEQVDAAVLAGAEVDRISATAASAQARLRSAEARVAEIRARIARHAVRAPFGGIVSRRHADPGDWVTPGRILLEVASTDELDVVVDVDPSLARSLSEGDAAMVRADGEHPATVQAVVLVLDPTTRTARVRLKTDAALLPGSAVTVVFDTEAALASGARVPRDAVTPNGDGGRVVLVEDGAAKPVDVAILATSPDAVLVDAVQPGATVVVRGNERLRPGQAVRVVEGG